MFLEAASEGTLSALASLRALPEVMEEFPESDSEDVRVCWLVVEQPLCGCFRNAVELRYCSGKGMVESGNSLCGLPCCRAVHQCQSGAFTLGVECRWMSTMSTEGRESATARDLHIGWRMRVRNVGAWSFCGVPGFGSANDGGAV